MLKELTFKSIAPRKHMKIYSTTLLRVLLILATIKEFERVAADDSYCRRGRSIVARPHSVSITDFGAVGDGVTLNTKAFNNAMFYLQSFADKGGAQLFVPAGRWLTGSFSLISHLTLSLDADAVILGSVDSSHWPIIEPLPSYGRGRELPGNRHQSLIHGSNLTDVTITGGNGTVDGQGGIWWDWFRNGTLNFTRPHLIELMYSTGIVISNLTFRNSPFWTIHPVYCSHVSVQNVTIIAPLDSPNTDGIDPDSSSNVCIEDCYISTGDDLIVIKSGWDEYGISFAWPSSNISINHVVGQTGVGAGIAFGSEMSGGISEVNVKNVRLFNSSNGIRIKTSPGRGGYVKNICISNVTMNDVAIAIRITGKYGEHPDENYDPDALPLIKDIVIKDVRGSHIGMAGLLEGIRGDEFSGIRLSNIKLFNVTSKFPWKCSHVKGCSVLVSPDSCEQLKGVPDSSSTCHVAADRESQSQMSSSESLVSSSGLKLPFL